MYKTLIALFLIVCGTFATAQQAQNENLAELRERREETVEMRLDNALDAAGLDNSNRRKAEKIIEDMRRLRTSLRNDATLNKQQKRKAIVELTKDTRYRLKDVMTANQWERYRKTMADQGKRMGRKQAIARPRSVNRLTPAQRRYLRNRRN